MRATRGALQRRRVVEISLDDCDSLSFQIACCLTAGVASQGPQLPTPGEQVADDRSPLASCGAGDEHGLVMIGHRICPRM